ncbi:glycosyltransferase family 2 protein [Proteus mirabilis]|nr:glycosyltransferase family 2 protein [Proteus mirabilis]MBG5956757.1 glycosyltransferase family 2 protein [Proteus mirabilis]
MLFSVIIPCFNAANYICDCLEELLKQTKDDTEIILIDDGSSDNTLSIINSYKENKQIKIIENKINMGVSFSRNKGIDHATGKFILFLDSDDKYINGLFDYLRETAYNNSNIDIISFSFLRKGGRYKKEALYSCTKLDKKIFNNSLFLKNFCTKKINQSICSAAFSRQLILKNKIYFDLNTTIGEDVEFQINSIICAKRIYYTSNIFFIYNYNESSVTNTKLAHKHLSFFNIYSRLKKIMLNKGMKKQIHFLTFYYTYSFFYLLSIALKSNDIELTEKIISHDRIINEKSYFNISNIKTVMTFFMRFIYKKNKNLAITLLKII